MGYANPVRRWLDRKIHPPVEWLAWRMPMPERLFDRILAYGFSHGGPGSRPTKREFAKARRRLDALPVTPRRLYELEWATRDLADGRIEPTANAKEARGLEARHPRHYKAVCRHKAGPWKDAT